MPGEEQTPPESDLYVVIVKIRCDILNVVPKYLFVCAIGERAAGLFIVGLMLQASFPGFVVLLAALLTFSGRFLCT